MGGACSAVGEETGVYRERAHWGDPGVDERIILRFVFRKWNVEWIELVRDRDRRRANVNAVINFRVP
jgi:hypothetical protein